VADATKETTPSRTLSKPTQQDPGSLPQVGGLECISSSSVGIGNASSRGAAGFCHGSRAIEETEDPDKWPDLPRYNLKHPALGGNIPGELKIAPPFLACYTVPLDSNGVDAENEGQSALTEHEIGAIHSGMKRRARKGIIPMM
jgi:hypothetical protein